MNLVRLGILGCARIAPAAALRPARSLARVQVVAVGSRDLERARRWAKRHRIPKAYGTYDEVLTDPEVDAVYIPLPNSLHAEWSMRALAVGKHVLCEKPLAMNGDEAERMAEAAERSGLVAMQAVHYRFHPLTARVVDVVRAELGELRRIAFAFSVPVPLPRDIRWDARLGGGAAMDLGTYGVDYACLLTSGAPEVLTAAGAVTRRGVDRSFEATLAFPDGVEARLRGSLLGPPWARLDVEGTRGELSVLNPILPQVFHRLRVRVDGTARSERIRDGTTYRHQLATFVDCIHEGRRPPTPFSDAVGTMRVVDAVRRLIGVEVP